MRAIDLWGGTEIVSEEDSLELLRSKSIGRLAMVLDDRIDIFPINYAIDGRSILFRTNQGHKMRSASDGEVAFEVDSIETEAHAGWSVVVHGEAEDVTGKVESGADTVEPWAGRKEFLVRITPRSITGRRVIPPSYQI
jgi:nitroimidazol reductase NimA-like FMN-containing flavoprotein (pyridoxamine 5'-phosphate oxidase superfamily)